MCDKFMDIAEEQIGALESNSVRGANDRNMMNPFIEAEGIRKRRKKKCTCMKGCSSRARSVMGGR